MIGTLYATVEQCFRALLRIGFASRFPTDAPLSPSRSSATPMSGCPGRCISGMSVLPRRPGRSASRRRYRGPMGYELVIVGGGNMGAALLGGLLASGR